MYESNSKLFVLNDIINVAIQQNFSSESSNPDGTSLSIINEMTYNNIFNSFQKWCLDQTELGFILNVYPFGNMFSIKDSHLEGISLKLNDLFLSQNGLRWDDSRFNTEKYVNTILQVNGQQVQKINIFAISNELQLPNIYVQNGLNNIFKAIGSILSNNSNCVIDLGHMGSIFCLNKLVYHLPSKNKNDQTLKKQTVKNLLRSVEDAKVRDITKRESFHKHVLDKSNNSTFIQLRNSILLKEHETQEVTSFDINNSSILINNSQSFLNKIRKKGEKREGDMIDIAVKVDPEWSIFDMLNNMFKKSVQDKLKLDTFPQLFNEFSHTVAVPFTSEKTKIPIPHRIGSFYSLSLLNYIIDKSSKSIKVLFDEYFFKYKLKKLLATATEHEEYLYYISTNEELKNEYKYIKIDEEKVNLRKFTYDRYKKYIRDNIRDEYISNIKERWLVNIARMCLRAYDVSNPVRYSDMLNACVKEIIDIYKISMKKSILDYMLKHPDQRDRLFITTSFRRMKEYAEEKIVRKSDMNWEWKRNWDIAKTKTATNLMIMNESTTKVIKFFTKTLIKTKYVDLPEESWDTKTLLRFVEIQKNKIEDEKKMVNDDWKKFVESILKDCKIHKDQLNVFFKSIAGLMSSQLRKLIINSIMKYHAFLKLFKKKEYNDPKTIFARQFDSKFGFERSFLELEIIKTDKGFGFSDELSEIHNKLIGLISEIIKCSQEVERADNMFIKNLEKRANLWEVPANDSVIMGMLNEIDLIIKENLDNTNKVLLLYEPYKFILTEASNLKAFTDTNPSREDIKKRIKYYEQNYKTLREDIPDSLYLNMIRIECTEINQLLRKSILDCIYDLLKFIEKFNIKGKSKELNQKIESLRDSLGQNADTEETLNQLETNLEYFKNDLVPSIQSDYRDFIEWVFFYFEYDIYKIFPDKQTDSLSSIDSTIKTTFSNINLIPNDMESFEKNLKFSREKFEELLNKSRVAYSNLVTGLKKEVETMKEQAPNHIVDEIQFLDNIKELHQKIMDGFNELKNLTKKEDLLGSYTTEDERHEQCLKDIQPMMAYVGFYVEYKVALGFDFIDVRTIDFTSLSALIEKSFEIFETATPKLHTLKSSITNFRKQFDNFRSSVELGKYINTLTFILNKYDGVDQLSEGAKFLLEENRIYCSELTKLIFDHDKGQDFLKTIKLKELRTGDIKDKFAKNKVEIEKIVQEWEIIKNNFEAMTKIMQEVDINIELDNFKDKKFIIVVHSNFEKIKAALSKSIKLVEENTPTETFKYSNRTIEKMNKFKVNLLDLKDIIEKFEACQLLFEKHIVRIHYIQRYGDLFIKLKQAEKMFKLMIDWLNEKPKLMDILLIKDSFRDNLNQMQANLQDIPEHLEGEPQAEVSK